MTANISTPRLEQELAKFEWSEYRPEISAYRLPAMAIALIMGHLFHALAAGIIIASGTLFVGFSSFRRLQGSRLLQMVMTCVGMSVAASLGTEAGRSPLAVLILAGLLAFLYGLVLVFSENASWIGLQCMVSFLVASAFPALGWHALLRGGLLLCGGVLQAGLVLALRPDSKIVSLREDFLNCRPSIILETFRTEIGPTLLRQVNHRLPVMRYAMRLGLTIILAVAVSRLLHQLNAYWLPMTTLLVMKPDFYRTYTNTMARVFGTFLGVILASAITWALHPSSLFLYGFVLLFAWLALSMQKVNYGLFTCVLTAFIVFLVAVIGLPEITVTANRLLDTALGSLIGLGSRAIGPRWDSVVTTSPQPLQAPDH